MLHNCTGSNGTYADTRLRGQSTWTTMARHQFVGLGSYPTAASVKLWILIKILVAASVPGLFIQLWLLSLIQVQRQSTKRYVLR